MVGWGISPNRAGAGRTGTIIAAPIWRWPSCDPHAASTIVRTAAKVGLEFTYRIIARERICIWPGKLPRELQLAELEDARVTPPSSITSMHTPPSPVPASSTKSVTGHVIGAPHR